MFADLEVKNIQSGRGPRSESDLLKWDNEINNDDDYEGKLQAHRHQKRRFNKLLPILVFAQCPSQHMDTI